jgi:hypothetical protein
MEAKHTARQHAERNYKAALAAVRAAEDVSETAWVAAKADLDKARRDLISAEEAFPTSKEVRRAANVLRLRNRGLDV